MIDKSVLCNDITFYSFCTESCTTCYPTTLLMNTSNQEYVWQQDKANMPQRVVVRIMHLPGAPFTSATSSKKSLVNNPLHRNLHTDPIVTFTCNGCKSSFANSIICRNNLVMYYVNSAHFIFLRTILLYPELNYLIAMQIILE